MVIVILAGVAELPYGPTVKRPIFLRRLTLGARPSFLPRDPSGPRLLTLDSRLSVLIAVKNHRALIVDCIESLRGIADEVLIADSGATDDTIELARAACGGDCTCRVIARQYVAAGNFKNWAIPQAAHPWVLIVDVDERLTGPLATEIREAMNRDDRCDGYWIYRLNYYLGRPVRFCGWRNDRVIRLIRRDLFRYPDESADHTEFKTKGRRVGRFRHRMHHFTRRSLDEHLEKCGRYSQVQARRWLAQGRRPSWLRMMLHPPLRFLRTYLAYGGILDGMAGLQLSYMAAYYAYLKHARLWELHQEASQTTCPADADPAHRRVA